MITYELAKQLKDAGWPQPGFDPLPVLRGEWVSDPNKSDASGYAYAPSFPELAAALPEKGKLEITRVQQDEWWAQHSNWTRELGLEDPLVGNKGASPDEALACLWLKLHEAKPNASQPAHT